MSALPGDHKIPDSVLGALNMVSRANARYANFLSELLASAGERHIPTDLDSLERKAAAQVKNWTGRTISLRPTGYVSHPTITPDIAVHFIRLVAGGCSAEQAARQQALLIADANQMLIDYRVQIGAAKARTGLDRDQYLHDLLRSWRRG